MVESAESENACKKKLVIVGCHEERHAAVMDIVVKTCEDAGWVTRWIRCPSWRLPSDFHLPNYLDGSWRFLVLNELRSGDRDKVLTGAEQEGIPAVHISDYSPPAIRDALERLDRPPEEPPLGIRVAAKVVRKLKRQNQWGGPHSFLWWDDLPRGGFESGEEQPFVHEVADILIKHDILVTKSKRSETKVALNGDERPRVERVGAMKIRDDQLRSDLLDIGF